ncbi:MAG: bifunctional hydroxymethylpyrimidine kinase/phosphomethylpyrimidine kinase [Burkholderiaceae bacterium]
MIPNVLSIAGVDPSGGAGIFADLKAFSALGAYGCAVVTALTAQNTRRVDGVSVTPTDFVTDQMDTLFDDVRIDAIKIGMLGTADLTVAVANGLIRHAGATPIVLDPVMIAKSGDALLAPEAVSALRKVLLPLATVLTPNLPEAGELLGEPAPVDLPGMRRAAEKLRGMLAVDNAWVLLKGGHLSDGPAIDLLHDGEQMIELSAPRVETKNTHGTGCTLSSSIAALLPVCASVPEAVTRAKDYLTGAISHSGQLAVGHGHGPVHHFWQIWPSK